MNPKQDQDQSQPPLSKAAATIERLKKLGFEYEQKQGSILMPLSKELAERMKIKK